MEASQPPEQHMRHADLLVQQAEVAEPSYTPHHLLLDCSKR
jgi:hypothetical protein